MPDLAQCVCTMVVYEQDGTPMPEGKATLTVLSIVKAGEFVEPSPGTARTKKNDASGIITITLPRLSNVTLQSKATAGKEVIDQFANAVTVSIPDSATANLEDLIAAADVPTEGIVVQDDGVGLANKVGTLNFGQGLVATETSAGVSLVKLPYKVYRALLLMTASSNPTATVLENSLSAAVVWTRSSAGTYPGTLVGAFLAGKVFCSVTIGRPVDSTTNGVIASLNRTSDNIVTLRTFDIIGSVADAESGGADDTWSVELLVFP